MQEVKLNCVPIEDIPGNVPIKNGVLKKMLEEADGIQEVLQRQCTLDNPTLLLERLAELDVYTARISDMLSRSKAMKEYAKTKFSDDNEEALSKMQATKVTRLMSAYLYEVTVVADRMSNMYSTVCKLTENLRTQISYIKEQMKNSLD